MSKRHKKPPVDFADYMARKREELSWPIVIGEQTFTVVHPSLLSGEDRQTLKDTDDELVAAALMIDDLDGFLAAGGTIEALGMFVEDVARGVDVDPESSGSSTS